jgi:methylmalonyl-CoA/ethylmalonyl-CoA epimerase
MYRDLLGASVSEEQELPEHGVTTVFVMLDNTKLELLHPLGDRSPIAAFLEKNKAGGIHHICIEVNDIEAAVADVKSKGIRCLSPEPRIGEAALAPLSTALHSPGAHGKPVMFLHPKDCNGVLVELEQE